MVYKGSQCREFPTIVLFLVLPAISGWLIILGGAQGSELLILVSAPPPPLFSNSSLSQDQGYYNHIIGHYSIFLRAKRGKISGLKYILARSDHQSEARKFSCQPIRKLETIQMFALFSLSVLFTSLASLEPLCLC